MKKLSCAVLVGSSLLAAACAASQTDPGAATAMPKAIVAHGAQPLYISNRPPLAPSPFVKLPIGSITPRGWLRTQLVNEANGMTGHLEELSHFCRFEGNAWVAAVGKGANAWEEVPYWLKGYGDLGYVLKDDKIIANARRWIDGVLASQQPDGYFGPLSNKTSLDKPQGGGEGYPDLWPHMVMLNVLQSFHEATDDPRVIPFMTRYMKWLDTLPPQTYSRGYWPKVRWGDNIESIYWLYNRTGDPFLLPLATRIHDNMQDWSTGVHNRHNVNIAQAFREPTVYWQQAMEEKFLHGAEKNYLEVMNVYGQFPGGGFAADENYRPGFTDPHQAFETCGMVEFMHSFEMLTRITGEPKWSDRCEDIAFNSLPAAITPDFTALHYLTAPNQVQLDRPSHSPGVQNGGVMFPFSPGEVYRCCQHNVSHGWPYYAEELFLASADKGLCASLYAASEVTAKVGAGQTVTIAEESDYPFSDTITFKLTTRQATTFPLYLRVPGWCESASVAVNGQTVSVEAKPDSYVRLSRTWNNGDTVSLKLPMTVNVKTWAKNKDAVSVSYGPIAFSLKIGERWSRYGGSDRFPENEVFPSTPWNYGLVLTGNASSDFEIIRKSSSGPNPFTHETVPIELRAKARQIPNWKLDNHRLAAALQQSPIKSDEPSQTVTLIPMGAARLRISMFPTIGDGPMARNWTAP